MSARAEQLVLDYLSRAADAAQGVLRPDERLRFVTRLRASIDRQRQTAGADDLGQVRRVLSKFGEPKALVEHERRRLDAAKAAAAQSADATAHGWAGHADPGRADPGARRDPAQPRGPGNTPRGGPGTTRPRIRTEDPGRRVPGATQPGRADINRRRPGTIQPGRADIGRRRVPGNAPVRAVPVGQVDPLTGGVAPGEPGVSQPAVDLVSIVRRFRREALVLALIGPGALVLPVPLWLIGAVIGLTSWVWSGRDKSIGLAGPFLVTVVGVGVIGALNKNPSIPIDMRAYMSAAHADAGILIRVSAVLGALYLAARLLRRYRATVRRSANR
jgi:hypothetical protein